MAAERRDRPVRTDRGQAVPLLLAVVVLCALAAVAVGRAGAALVAHQRAQQAADAAALAGVDGGERRASAIAAANGATVEAFHREVVTGARLDVVTVTVTVRAGGSSATARATNGP